MTGSDKCEYCEIPIAKVMADKKEYTKIEHHSVWRKLVVIYYCGECWLQQQSRMFG